MQNTGTGLTMQYIKTGLKALSLAVIIAAGLIGIICYRADLPTLVIFLLFVLAYTLLPGCFLSELLGLKGTHLSTSLARGFFLGFALNIVLYYISELSGTDLLLYGAGPVLSALFLFRKGRGRRQGEARIQPLQMIGRMPAGWFVFCALVLLMAFCVTQYKYISPQYSAFSSIRLDYEYHCGIMNALAQGYPPVNPWVDGRTIEYHFFTEMFYAVPMRLFGLTSEAILMSCSPWLVTGVLSVSLYSFFREMMKRADRIGLYCLGLLGANMLMVKSFASSWLMFHLISNINNASYGICCLLITVPVLGVWNGSSADDPALPDQKTPSGISAFHLKEGLFLILMTMLMTGIKGPVGIAFLGAAFGTAVLGLFFRRKSWRILIPLALCAAGFLIVYTMIIGGSDSGSSGGGSLINIGEITDIEYFRVHFKEPLMAVLQGMGIPGSLQKLLLLSLFVVFSFTAFLLPFTIGYIRELVLVFTRRKEYLVDRVTVYACCMVGFLGLMVLNYSGHSQVYFGFVAAIFAPAVSYWFFEDMQENRGVLMKLVRIVFAVSLVLTSAVVAFGLWDGIQDAAHYYHTKDKQHNKYREISTLEYEGMMWLKENAQEEDLIASDRYYSIDPKKYDYANRWMNVHFAYAVYSQRRHYLEGSGFSLGTSERELRKQMIWTNDLLHDPDNENRGQLARDLGVDYVVVSRRFSDVDSLENKDYTLCFHNDDMDIYHVE